MVCWRRRQPEPEALGLLGREPARLVPAHQGAADLRVHKQPVQSQIRDLRHFFRSAVDGRGRDTERAVRPPHGHAGAAALGLCRPASEAVMNFRGIIELSTSPRACPIRARPHEVSHGANISLPSRSTSRQSGDPQTVKSPTTEIVKPILLIVTAIVALGSIVARADAIDTEHLFGFTIGTDIGEVGEKEFESNTLSRLGKRAGSYSALSQSLFLEYTAVQNLRLEVSATGVYYDIVGVPGLDDRRQGAFDGLSFDMRYRILDRAHAPCGLMID